MLEIRIPISPTPSMINRVHLITHSIRSLGGEFASAHVRVSVGSPDPERDLHAEFPWSRKLDIEWAWVSKGEFLAWANKANPHIGTMTDRLKPPYRANRIIFLDADVLAVNPFEPFAEKGIAGVMAHVSPFNAHKDTWIALIEESGLPCLWQVMNLYSHSGFGVMEGDLSRKMSPAYFNTGVVFFDVATLEALRESYLTALTFAQNKLNSYFCDQIAYTLAGLKSGLPFHVLPVRYNFPNQGGFDTHYPDDLADIKFLHFLRTYVIDREHDFSSIDMMHRLAARTDLRGSNEILRARVAQLLPLMEADL